MDAMKYVSTLVAVVVLVSGAYSLDGPFFRPHNNNNNNIPAQVALCAAGNGVPCFGQTPVRCYYKADECDGRPVCRYMDDEVGCGSGVDPTETRTVTIQATSTVVGPTSTSTSTTTTTTTTTSSSLTTSTLISLQSSTSVHSVTPTVGAFNSKASTTLSMFVSATYVQASLIPAGNIPGPGNVCIDYAAAPAGAAGADRWGLVMSSVVFTGTLSATAICYETTVSV